MIGPLTLLVRAELRGRRLRGMLLLGVVVVLAGAAIVSGLEAQTRAAQRWDRAFAEANGAHVTVSARDPRLLELVVRDERVADATGVYREIGGLELRAGRNRAPVHAREMAADERPHVATPLLRDGRWAAGPGEVVVDRALALDRGYALGDVVRIGVGEQPPRYAVVGFAIDLIDCFFPQCDPATVWMDREAFTRLGTEGVSNSVFLRLEDPSGAPTFASGFAATRDLSFAEWIDTRDDALVAAEFFSAFLAGFGVFVMFAVAVVVASSMATRIAARRRDIGLLKAVGCTPVQIALVLVAAHAAVAGVAAGLGWVVGGWAAGAAQLRIGEVLGTGGASYSVGTLLVVLAVVEGIVVVTVAAPAWWTGRMSTAAALSPAARTRRSRPERGVATLPFGRGAVGVTAVRIAWSRPVRAALTAGAVFLAVVVAVVAAGFGRTVGLVLDDPARTGDPGDVVVDPRDVTPADIRDVLGGNDLVRTWYTQTDRRAVVDGERVLVRALGDDVARAGFVIPDGHVLATDREAIAGYGLLQRLGVAIGDHVRVEIGGESVAVTVVGRHLETEDSGEVLQISLDALRAVEPNAGPGVFVVHGTRDATEDDREVLRSELAATFGERASVGIIERESTDELDAFRLSFIVATVLVVAIAIANLASTMLLVVRQRMRDLGVLRALGFTPTQIASSVAGGAIGLALVATAIGIPVGWALYWVIIDDVSRSLGVGAGFAASPPLGTVALLVPAAAVTAALVGAAAAREAITEEPAALVRWE